MKILLPLFLLAVGTLFAQLNGRVIDENQNPIQDVSVLIENTYNGTVTNSDGQFYLLKTPKSGKLVFHYLGYETISYSFTSSEDSIFIQMKESPVTLSEVEVSQSENPAHRIVRKAQKKRKEFLNHHAVYTAEFYSRGIFRMKDVPEKFLGIAIGDFEGALDSTRSGILYLSETQSKIFKNKNKFNEVVYASKVSGDSNGFSFNAAKDADLNFYENTLDFGNAIASPIGEGAFNYYKYKLEDSFYTSQGKLINKIKLIPKTDTAPAFKGIIYIVEDDWAIYGLDVVLERKRTHINGIDNLHIVQQFQYHESDQRWSKTNQFINFEFGLFNFKGNGRFSAVYTNYDFSPTFAPKTFGPALQTFEKHANTLDSIYWNKTRPIQLTAEEEKDYQRRDSIYTLRHSAKYLDSIDQKNNRFKWNDLLGKTIQNSQKKSRFTITTPARLSTFNAVQGYALGTELRWEKDGDTSIKKRTIATGISYGFSDKMWYPYWRYDYLQNSSTYHRWAFFIGRELVQFNHKPAVTPMINQTATLFFKSNLARFYELNRLGIMWSGYVHPRLHISYSADYLYRTPRSNTTQHSVGFPDRDYAENRPDNPNYDFDSHHLVKQQFRIQYKHKQYYFENPNQRFYMHHETNPRITLDVTNGMGSTLKRYNFLKIDLYWRQSFAFGTVGQSDFGFRLGRYLNKNRPSFMDATHFHGNAIFVRNNNFRSFQLLPYYERSTTQNHGSIHLEHDFFKWGIGSWPLFKQLQASLFIGGNALFIDGHLPYWEGFIGLGNIGIGKIRGLRIDYVQSWYGKEQNNGVRFGLNLF